MFFTKKKSLQKPEEIYEFLFLLTYLPRRVGIGTTQQLP